MDAKSFAENRCFATADESGVTVSIGPIVDRADPGSGQ